MVNPTIHSIFKITIKCCKEDNIFTFVSNILSIVTIIKYICHDSYGKIHILILLKSATQHCQLNDTLEV